MVSCGGAWLNRSKSLEFPQRPPRAGRRAGESPAVRLAHSRRMSPAQEWRCQAAAFVAFFVIFIFDILSFQLEVI